jgi:signal transduction histidine kinase
MALEVNCQQEEVIFSIRDRGIGIPNADQFKLFDSFYRGSNVGTISGTGLGLAIVKRAVDLHGGKIAFESEVGVGTTFIVSLPVN